MRVIAGKYRGIRLNAVKGDKTRPTTDKIKEAMFSVLMPYLKGGSVLDLYAGTGGLGIEAVSRGMSHATLVDQQAQAAAVITSNLDKLHDPAAFTLLRMPAKRAVAALADQDRRFAMLFLDPPYAKAAVAADVTQLLAAQLLVDGAIIIVETDRQADLLDAVPGMTCFQQKHYGITVLTFYRYDCEDQ